MSSTPVKHPLGAQPSETLAERFCQLAAAWQKAVGHHSSNTLRYNHPTYQEIIQLGPEVIPLLLRDMEENHTHWFAALRQLSGANPVPESAAGKIPKMLEVWLQWAKDNGYRW